MPCPLAHGKCSAGSVLGHQRSLSDENSRKHGVEADDRVVDVYTATGCTYMAPRGAAPQMVGGDLNFPLDDLHQPHPWGAGAAPHGRR